MVNERSLPRILQICHGKIIPRYSSAYALRCIRYLSGWSPREIISVGGLTFKDEIEGDAQQFRSLLLTVSAFLKGDRSFEIYLAKGKYLRSKYKRKLLTSISKSEIVIFEGPWQYPLVKDQLRGKIVIYDAHNVETVLRGKNRWKDYVRMLESDLCERADVIITVSSQDSQNFVEMFNVDSSKVVTIPEGFEEVSRFWKYEGSKEVVFIGSAYLPNVQAARNVIDIAKKLPEFKFKLMGSVCNVLKKREVPGNVALLGVVDEEHKTEEMVNSLLAVNPVEMGSGRNLKMNDYISHGVPILTTPIGIRGFEDELRKYFFVEPIDRFAERIREISHDNDRLMEISRYFVSYSNKHSYKFTIKETTEAILNLITKT